MIWRQNAGNQPSIGLLMALWLTGLAGPTLAQAPALPPQAPAVSELTQVRQELQDQRQQARADAERLRTQARDQAQSLRDQAREREEELRRQARLREASLQKRLDRSQADLADAHSQLARLETENRRLSQQRDRQQARADRLEQQSQDLRAKQRESDDLLQQVQQLLSAAERDLRTKTQQADALQRRLEQQQQQLAQLRDRRREDASKAQALKAEISRLRQARHIHEQGLPDGRTRIRLALDDLFTPNGGLSRQGSALLKQAAKEIHNTGSREIHVEAYLDRPGGAFARPGSPYRATRRYAQAVVDFLQGLAELRGARVTPIPRGDSHPIADNFSPQGRAANRRIDLLADPPLPGPAAPLPFMPGPMPR